MKSIPMKRWTDDDLAVVQEMWDRPLAETAAALGVSKRSIGGIRKRIKVGGSPRKLPWTVEEDVAILEGGHLTTAADIALKLPGRTKFAVIQRRQRLGVKTTFTSSAPTSPFRPGSRPLLARTCAKCGLLLPAAWFFLEDGRWRRSFCRKCEGKGKRQREADDSCGAAERREVSRQFQNHAQSITKLYAARSGHPYVEADYEVLNNPDLTVLQKALRIQRTYSGTKHALAAAGIKASNSLGDPERDQWIIDNPNLANLEAIQASLAPVTPDEPKRPAFDWDD